MDAALLLVLFSFIGLLEASVCPAEEDIWPCECFSASVGIYVRCTHVHKPEELIPPMRALEKSKTEVWQLTIDNSTMMYLPDQLFKNISVKKVQFLDANITSISESDSAFFGLENSLIRIYAENVAFPLGLHFYQFRNLRVLEDINFSGCDMHAAIHHLPHLPRLTYLKVATSEISYISNKAFSHLPDLAYLWLYGNHITDMKRSMLPNPAKKLVTINLSFNRLSSLPNDFFENMPNLQSVELNNNKFKILAEKPFSDALKIGGLSRFDMLGNPLQCDCSLSWLGDIRFPVNFLAWCATPKNFSEKSIETLNFKSLKCK